jgi:hypothetical protein
VSDAWDDEGFGPEDDWEGTESVESDLEDDALVGLDDELDDAELEEDTVAGDEEDG